MSLRAILLALALAGCGSSAAPPPEEPREESRVEPVDIVLYWSEERPEWFREEVAACIEAELRSRAAASDGALRFRAVPTNTEEERARAVADGAALLPAQAIEGRFVRTYEWMFGVVVRRGAESRAILSPTPDPADTLERVADAIADVSGQHARVGIASGIVMPEGGMRGARLLPVDLTSEIDPSLDALVVVAPELPLDAAARERVVAFAEHHGVAIFASRARTRFGQQMVLERMVETGLEPWLESLGIALEPALVADEEAMEVPGPGQIVMRYPPLPRIAIAEEPILQGIPHVMLAFPSPITIAPGSSARPLLTTSALSWRIDRPTSLDPRPVEEWRPSARGAEIVAVVREEAGRRLMVVGSSSLFDRMFMPNDPTVRGDERRAAEALIAWVAGRRVEPVALGGCALVRADRPTR